MLLLYILLLVVALILYVVLMVRPQFWIAAIVSGDVTVHEFNAPKLQIFFPAKTGRKLKSFTWFSQAVHTQWIQTAEMATNVGHGEGDLAVQSCAWEWHIQRVCKYTQQGQVEKDQLYANILWSIWVTCSTRHTSWTQIHERWDTATSLYPYVWTDQWSTPIMLHFETPLICFGATSSGKSAGKFYFEQKKESSKLGIHETWRKQNCPHKQTLLPLHAVSCILNPHPSLSVPMCILSAAEGSNPRGKHPLPARPVLPGWSAACWLCPHLPCEEAWWGPLQSTVNTPADWERCRPQPTPWRPQPWHPQPWRTSSTPPSTKAERFIVPAIITSGWCGAGLSGRDLQWPGGS